MTRSDSSTLASGAHISSINWLLIALIAFLAELVALGAVLWRAPLIYDEATYYLPAIQAYAVRLLEIGINPPFPGPPTGLLLQVPVYLAFHGSTVALRVTSTLAAAAMAAVVYTQLRRYGTAAREALQLLLICASMFVMFQAFVFKHHALMLFFLVAGIALWEVAITSSASPYLLLLSSLSLVLAITTNQLVAPVCIALAFESWRTRRQPDMPPWPRRAAAALLPLAVLALFFAAWHGAMPPAYKSNPTVQMVKFGTVHPVQVLALFLVIGVWLAPTLGVTRRSLTRSAILAIPFGVAFYFADVYRPGTMFFESIVGPISSVLRALRARSALASAGVGGLVAGFGADFVIRCCGGADERRVLSFEVLVAAYAGMMLVVPYLFEGYYFVLVITTCIVLSRKMLDAWPSNVAAAHKILVAVVGAIYVVYKLSIEATLTQ